MRNVPINSTKQDSVRASKTGDGHVQLGTELNSVPKTLRLAKMTAKKICPLRTGSCPSIPLNFMFFLTEFQQYVTNYMTLLLGHDGAAISQETHSSHHIFRIHINANLNIPHRHFPLARHHLIADRMQILLAGAFEQ